MEETTETVESTETSDTSDTFGFNVTDCTPHTKYTNTNANIRSIPDKSGELVNTVATNTELTVTGTTDNGWSRVETVGLVAYIKSSLLSDTKVEVRQPSNTSASNQGVETQTQAQTPSQPQQTQPTQTPSQPQTPSQGDPNPADFGWDDGGDFSDVPTTGTTGHVSDGSFGGAY